MTRYFYSDTQSQPIGPYTIDELKQLHLTGAIHSATWVIEEGGTQWQPYSNLVATGANFGDTILPQVPPPANPTATTKSTAFLWFVCCMPLGFMQWGQTVKGWVWLVAIVLTSGIGIIPALIDYWMNFSVQQRRKVGEWEFFPTR